MVMELDHDLLRACAAYLLHVDVYVFDGDDDDVETMLLDIALTAVDAIGKPCPSERVQIAKNYVRHHINAIYAYVAGPIFNPAEPGLPKVRAVALAIIDAPVVEWWCRRLAKALQSAHAGSLCQ